ncbi:MAG: hypothetical protein ACRDV3_11940 [Acidothermaceae bacterium]
MTDLDTFFESARTTQIAPPATIDADVTRGKRALNRRRIGRTPIAAGLAVIAGLGVFAATQSATKSSGSSTSASSMQNTATANGAAIRLVSYAGTQPQGYTVDLVPTGWEIQGVDNYVLTIAPVGDADQNVDSFAGKLVVMLRSQDDTGVRTGDHVVIGSAPGVVDKTDPSTAQLFFNDAAGHRVDIQVPSVLRWSDAQMAAFAASVHVNATAVAGVG